MRHLTILVVGLLVFGSCKKPEDRTCWKFAGNESEKVIYPGSFDKIIIKEHMIVELIQDSLDQLVIRGGKNLISQIDATVSSDHTLTIDNLNKCAFLRSYNKKVHVEVHFTDIYNMEFWGTEPLTNRDTIQVGWFTLLIKDGAGPVTLNMRAEQVFANISHGWGNLTLNGRAKYTNLNIRSNGYCDAYNFKSTDSITVISNTQGHTNIWADQIPLKTEIDADGNVNYIGNPSNIKLYRYGNGNLIKAD